MFLWKSVAYGSGGAGIFKSDELIFPRYWSVVTEPLMKSIRSQAVFAAPRYPAGSLGAAAMACLNRSAARS